MHGRQWEMTDIPRDHRVHCWDRAVECFGTGRIFQLRAEQLAKSMRVLDFLGIVVPLLVGGIAASVGFESGILPYVLVLAGMASTIQLVGTGWSLVATWRERLNYARESSTDNLRMAERYETLAKQPSPLISPHDTELVLLDAERQTRTDRDNQQDLTDLEKRMGLREGLRQFRRTCVGCGKVPTLVPTDCDICGTGGLAP
jgi:mobilome CxxCx(11)CxxC protein